MYHPEIKRNSVNSEHHQLKESMNANHSFSKSMYSIPVSPRRKEDSMTLLSLNEMQRREEVSNINYHLHQTLKNNHKRFSQSQGSLVPPLNSKLPESNKKHTKPSKIVQAPHNHHKLDSRNKHLIKTPNVMINDKIVLPKGFQYNRQRLSIGTDNKKPSINDNKFIDSSLKYSKEQSLHPVKMPQIATLSPLDALKAKAEAELNKQHPSEIKSGKYQIPNFGKLDLQWTKELASVNHELHKLEASIGVDKRQSIAHFRSTVSPLLNAYDDKDPFNSLPIKPASPKTEQSKEIYSISRLPPPSQRASLPLIQTFNTLISKQKRVSITLSPEYQDSKSNYLSSSSSTSSAGSLPITPQNDPAFLQSENEFSSTLAQELAWERRQRFLLEVRLSEEKERCQKLEQELSKLKISKH